MGGLILGLLDPALTIGVSQACCLFSILYLSLFKADMAFVAQPMHLKEYFFNTQYMTKLNFGLPGQI